MHHVKKVKALRNDRPRAAGGGNDNNRESVVNAFTSLP